MRSPQLIFSRFQANGRAWIKVLSASILCPAVAVCAKLLLSSWMSTDRAPFLLFFGAVVSAGWIGGLWAGLLATAVSAILADLLFFLLSALCLSRDQAMRLISSHLYWKRHSSVCLPPSGIGFGRWLRRPVSGTRA